MVANKAEHTPGPWHIDDNSGYLCVFTWPTGHIAISGKAMGDVCVMPAEHAANARLIAAAPDLLAACKDMLGAFHLPDKYEQSEILPIMKARDAIRAAIAKVEGT